MTNNLAVAGIAVPRANGRTWGGRKPGSPATDPSRVRVLSDKGLGHGEVATAHGARRPPLNRMLPVADH